MRHFLNGEITEKELLDKTRPGAAYECIYLCSATTLPEYRGQGNTKKLCLQAISAICASHPVKSLFVWPFTPEGEKLAESLANQSGLVLHKKTLN